MSNEYSPNIGIDDLLSMEDPTADFIQESVNLKTGIGGNEIEDVQAKTVMNPHAIRWVFNPFEIIDLANKPVSCGMSYLRNVIFNKVKTVRINVGKPYGENSQRAGVASHDPSNYTQTDHTAYQIAKELEEQYGDKGVVEISEILDASDETAADLNTLLFGEEIECVVDPNDPEHPCPVLPQLAEVLAENIRANVPGLDEDTRKVVVAAARKIRTGIERAIKNARTRIDIAQQRILDEKSPNRTLSNGEQRCYLALGEEIPNVMPFTTRKAAGMFNTAGQTTGIDADALAQGITQGITAGLASMQPQKPVLQAPKSTVASDFSVSESDIAATEGETEPIEDPFAGMTEAQARMARARAAKKINKAVLDKD